MPVPVIYDTRSNLSYIRQSKGQQILAANYCSCVLFAKQVTGFDIPIGQAKNWPINSYYASVGGVVITRESMAGHVSVIQEIREGQMRLLENNYVHCVTTSTRWLPMDSPLIVGYWVNP